MLDYCCSVLAGVSGTLQRRLQLRTRNATPPRTSLAEGSRENPISFMCSCPPLPSRQCATVPCWDPTSDVWRWITPPSQVWIDIDTTCTVNATSHSRWPCFSSGRCTGLKCIAFVGQNIVNVLGISSPAENSAIQGILWRPDMIALSICCTALTANFEFLTQRFVQSPCSIFCDSVTIILTFIGLLW